MTAPCPPGQPFNNNNSNSFHQTHASASAFTPISSLAFDPDETQLNSQLTMDFRRDPYLQVHSSEDSEEDDEITHVSVTQDTLMLQNLNSIHPIAPREWDGASPDAVLARMKELKDDVLAPLSLKGFYKSYNNWSKMKPDQQDKALAWFRKLPEQIQRQLFNVFFTILLVCMNH
jgi:hypothetical protein